MSARMTVPKARALLDAATPGPWEVEFDSGIDLIVTPDGYAVAYNADSPEIGRGNSALVAAAPDLAAAVIAQDEEMERLRRLVGAARIALLHPAKGAP